MRPTPVILRLGGALAAAAVAAAPGMAMAADAAHPTVVELFQSQGCSSCPPANANVMAVSDRPDVLALSWQVTYWDNAAWKDTFDSPGFTERQWDYAHAFHRGEVFTPQVVINGRHDLVGFDRGELNQAIRAGDRGAGGPSIVLAGDHVTVSGQGPQALVLLVRYDPNVVQVPVNGGENAGRTLPHKNVVRQTVRLGQWAGGAHTYVLPAPSRPGLKTAVLVQSGPGGPILAAARG